jgi:hypothetical protein
MCGTTRLTVDAEHPDSAPNENGNPIRNKSGFQFGGGISLDSFKSGDVSFPLDFKNMWSYVNVRAPHPGAAGKSDFYYPAFTHSSGGYGEGYYHSRCEQGPSAIVTDPVTGGPYEMQFVVGKHDHTFNLNYDYSCGKFFVATAGGNHAEWNVAEKALDDIFDAQKSNNYFGYNWAFDWHAGAGHNDFIQHITSAGDTNSYTGWVNEYNLASLGDTAGQTAGFQCMFGNTVTASFTSGAIFRNNACDQALVNGIAFAKFNAPVVKYNTILQRAGFTVTGGGPALITFNQGGTDATISHNLSSNRDFSGQLGAITQTPNPNQCVQFTANANGCAVLTGPNYYSTILPHYTTASAPGWKTRLQFIEGMTPANVLVSAGGAVNDSDHTVNGVFTPHDVNGQTCDNDDGVIFDAAKTCAQMGTRVAQ